MILNLILIVHYKHPLQKMKQIFIPSLNQEISYSVGKNEKDNFNIIDNSHEKDIWFHLDNTSSCHVVAHVSNFEKLDKKQLRQIVTQGAVLCKSNSKSKSEKNIVVNYTFIKNITKTDTPGAIITSNIKSIKI